jgi:protein subunit release factor A
MKEKQLLFSLTKKDFAIETFCTGGTGGPGGQHKNAKKNGVRIKHLASGAVAQETTHREQFRNKEVAFRKLVQTKAFLRWHKWKVAEALGTLRDLDKLVDGMMSREQDFKVETVPLARK